MSYLPVLRAAFKDNSEPHDHRNTTTPTEPATQFSWPDGPRTLKRQGLVFFFSWVWDSLLTICPIFFVVLAILALRLDGQAISSYGKALSQITLLSPTIYPIRFAAVAGRFYKNLARWCLEKREGIELAVLEQIFGSQSLAGALERLLFLRTQVLIGLLILLTWGLSPLGGQSTARLLYVGTNTTINSGTIHYVHPSYQDSSFEGVSRLEDSKVGANTLYISSLLSSSAQKRSSRDLWDLPRIPQLPAGVLDEEEVEVGQHALGQNDSVYASLLGIKIQGLNFPTEGAIKYDFNVETSYFDFDCDRVGTRIPINTSYTYFPTAAELFRPRPDTHWWNTFAANLTVTDTYNKSTPLNDVPPVEQRQGEQDKRDNEVTWRPFDERKLYL